MRGLVIEYGLMAVLITVLLTLLARKPAHTIGLVDRPGGRKQHDGAVPLTGGPAMVAGFMLLALAFQALPSPRYVGLYAGVLVLGLVGAWDDLRGVSAGKRLIAQFGVALVCMEWLGDERVTNLGDLTGLGDLHLS